MCGIQRLEMFERNMLDKMPLGMKISTSAPARKKLNAKEHGITRTMLLALHAPVREPFSTAGLLLQNWLRLDTALIGASTVGGMCLTG